MRRILSVTKARSLWLLVMVLLPGCASVQQLPESTPVAQAQEAPDLVWQRVRFYVHWDRGQEPKWYVDTMLAHRVVGPVLQRERASISLWRFHRRANDDAAGHSVSFLTYAARVANEALCRSIKGDSLVEDMLKGSVLTKVECEGFADDKERLVEATSDTRWSPALQRAWPYYIMGVSETWLRLIDEHSRAVSGNTRPQTLAEILSLYEKTNEAVTQIWRGEGEHAFLHHLSALFGYEPVTITERKLHRF